MRISGMAKIFLVVATLLVLFALSSFYTAGTTLKSKEVISLNEEPPIPDFLTDTNNIKLFDQIDHVISSAQKNNNFHGSVLVAKKGHIIFKSHYGYADLHQKTPITDHSAFQLASVSKQITAAAVMILYEEDKISLDDSLYTFYADFPYPNITIRQLLNHTSGLPKYFWLAEHKWESEIAPTNQEIMSLFNQYKIDHFFPPGANFDYSNSGYMVLASIVEKVTGVPFNQYVEEKIFDPLGMKDSFVYSCTLDTIRQNQLSGYYRYRGWRYAKNDATVNDGAYGDKNIYSTTNDLFKWITGLNNLQLVDSTSLSYMYQKGENKYGREVPYGFGFRIEKLNDEPVIYHDGKWNGFRTSLKQYPDEDLIIIVLEHTSYNYLNGLIRKIKPIAEKVKV